MSTRSGTKAERQLPSSHGSDQKRVEVPSPTSHLMEALKKAWEIGSTRTRGAGRFSEILESQSQRSRRARPRIF
ncbi:hypothetical protein BAE44_0009583, partial [Dichanthelium oligosanthes]